MQIIKYPAREQWAEILKRPVLDFLLFSGALKKFCQTCEKMATRHFEDFQNSLIM